MARSGAYIIIKGQGATLHFTGVTEITHQIRLKIFDKADITEAASFVNGAKNEPDRVTLSVIETDAAHEAAGWSARMLEAMAEIGVKVENVEIGHVDFLRDAAFIKIHYTPEHGESVTIGEITRAKDYTA